MQPGTPSDRENFPEPDVIDDYPDSDARNERRAAEVDFDTQHDMLALGGAAGVLQNDLKQVIPTRFRLDMFLARTGLNRVILVRRARKRQARRAREQEARRLNERQNIYDRSEVRGGSVRTEQEQDQVYDGDTEDNGRAIDQRQSVARRGRTFARMRGRGRGG